MHNKISECIYFVVYVSKLLISIIWNYISFAMILFACNHCAHLIKFACHIGLVQDFHQSDQATQ